MHIKFLPVIAVAASWIACSSGQPPARQPSSEVQTSSARADADPDDRVVAWSMRRGKAALDSKAWGKARDTFVGVLDRRPDHAWATHYLAVALDHLGERNRAEATYRKALALDPRLASSAAGLSDLLVRKGDAEAAIEVLRSALKESASDPNLHIHLGQALALAGNESEAAGQFRIALDLANDARLRLRAASGLAKLGETEAALRVVRRLAVSERDPAVLADVGRALHDAGADDDCVRAMTTALRESRTAALYVQRGICLHALSKDGAARNDYKHALELDSNDAAAHYHLAELYLAQGNKKTALQLFKRCAQLAPDSAMAQRAQERIRGTRPGR